MVQDSYTTDFGVTSLEAEARLENLASYRQDNLIFQVCGEH